MKYTVRWCDHEGNERFENVGTDLELAVEIAQELDLNWDGVEVVDEKERPVWPFRLEDADL